MDLKSSYFFIFFAVRAIIATVCKLSIMLVSGMQVVLS